MSRVLVIGCGGVANVAIRKCCQVSDVFTELCIASRTKSKCDKLVRNVYGSQIHIFDNYIPFSVRMKEAVREGQSIFSYDPKGKATEAYRRVTEEVLKDAI